MPVVTICNHKGGTGKTTTVIHLAAAAGLAGRRVLVVDFDPQGFLTRMLGATEPEPEQSSLALLSPTAELRAVPTMPMNGFALLPASYTMTKAQRKLNRPTDVFWVKETLAQGHDYDLIFFDTAAALSVFTMNALVASDHVLIPVTPEYQPVVGAEQTWQTSRLVREKLNPGLQEPIFLLTQTDARKRDHFTYARYLRDTYGDRVARSAIRTNASLAETTHDGRTVFDTDVASRGARDYANAADELSRHYFPQAGAPATAPAPPPAPPERLHEVTEEHLATPPAPPRPVPAEPSSPAETAASPPTPTAAPPPPPLPWTTLDRL